MVRGSFSHLRLYLVNAELIFPSLTAEPQEGEAEDEPEIDLAAITRKQLQIAEREEARAAEGSSSSQMVHDDEDVDLSILAKTKPGTRSAASRLDGANSKKGKTVMVEYDASLDELAREKAAAEALSGSSLHYQ